MNVKPYHLFVLLYFFIGHSSAFSQSDSEVYKSLKSKLAQGWNIWNYESMLSFVKLPEALAINVSFRPAGLGTPYDGNYHFNKIIYGKESPVKPQAHAFDGSYTNLMIDHWKGNVIQIQSAIVNNNLVLLITPLENSGTNYFIEIETGFLYNQPGCVVRRGNGFEAKNGADFIQVFSTRDAEEIARPYTSAYQIFNAGVELGISTGQQMDLRQIKEIIATAENKFNNDAKKYGELAEAYKATQSVLGWNTLFDADLKRVITPVSRGWNEAWQGFVLFEWDTYFAALLLGLDHKELAYSNAIAVSNGVNRYGAVAFHQQPRNQLADNSQPPVGSMVCWKLYEKYREKWFLEEVYQNLLSWNRWWDKNRKNQGYITWGASWPNANTQDGAWESGLDNSPMYEDVKMVNVGQNSLFNLADVGLNSLYVMDCQYLEKIALELGKSTDAKEIKGRGIDISKKVQTLWSEEKGIYLNKNLDTGELSNRLAPTLFYPMIAAIPSSFQAERMLKEHYFNPDEFYGDYILPSCARNDKSFDNLYWRGAIWGPMNFLVYLGLKNYDNTAASELAQKSYVLFMVPWKKYKYIYENTHSVLGPSNFIDQVNSDPYYHWGALMGLMQFIEKGLY